MYFTHCQIEFSFSNLKKIFFSFFKNYQKDVLKKLEKMFPQREIVLTDLGRTAFKLIIEKFSLKNSSMILPAFICDIFLPIFKQYNIKPIFVDIEKETFNLKIKDVLEKITPETKSILICHTFGLPFDVEKLKLKLREKIFIIEDCAHSFGAQIGNVFCGNFGKAAIFSLYKQFPTARGGLAIFENKNFEFPKDLEKTNFHFRDFLSLLNHFPFFAFIFKKFGKQISPKIQRREKTKRIGGINKISLNLFFNFWEDFEKNLEKRKELGLFFQTELKNLGFEVQYSPNSIFTLLSALCPKTVKRDQLVKNLRKKGIFATRIWKDPIILNTLAKKEYKINWEEFENTIEVAQRIINFPLQNHYQEKDIKKMILKIKEILK